MQQRYYGYGDWRTSPKYLAEKRVHQERLERVAREGQQRREAEATAAAAAAQARFNGLSDPQKFAEHVGSGRLTDQQAKLAAALELPASGFNK